MEIALKVIVGVGALVLLLSLFLIKSFSWLVKKGVITFSAAPTPSRIRLEQDPDVRWQDEFERDKARSKLGLYDLKDLGYFTIYEMKGVILNAFVHAEKGLLVVLYEHPAVGQWVDFAVQYHDGGSFTVTSAKAGHELERRPNHDKIYCPGASVEALYEKFQTETPAKDVVQIPDTPEIFIQFFQDAYKEEMDWRNARSGQSAEDTYA